MAKKKRRRAAGRRKSDQRKPNWTWMLMGLAVGLAVAGYVYFSGVRGPAIITAEPKPPVAVTTLVEPKEPEQATEEVEGITFDFYHMLPNLDVEVYEDEKPVVPEPQPQAPQPASTPGIYILQAGSFSQFADANRRKAQMALLGVRAEIKRGTAGTKTVYRVYTSPLNTPADVNRVSKQLNDANIEVLRKRVSN
jgi:cell division protein FtsN